MLRWDPQGYKKGNNKNWLHGYVLVVLIENKLKE